jgi:hypothetical protein
VIRLRSGPFSIAFLGGLFSAGYFRLVKHEAMNWDGMLG